MGHYSEQLLIDFVRRVPVLNAQSGLLENAALQSHLARGCKDCAAALHVWQRVQSMAAAESNYRPPEYAIRMVKMEFAARQSRDAGENSDANLVFDTVLRPVLAGVRSAAAAARQMVYEAEGFTVDLRFDRKPHSNTVHLIGQILDSARTGTLLRTLPVTLCTDTGVLIAEGSTNDLGEFHLEFEALDHLRLSIWTRSKLIRIVLANLRFKAELDQNGDRTDAGNQ